MPDPIFGAVRRFRLSNGLVQIKPTDRFKTAGCAAPAPGFGDQSLRQTRLASNGAFVARFVVGTAQSGARSFLSLRRPFGGPYSGGWAGRGSANWGRGRGGRRQAPGFALKTGGRRVSAGCAAPAPDFAQICSYSDPGRGIGLVGQIWPNLAAAAGDQTHGQNSVGLYLTPACGLKLTNQDFRIEFRYLIVKLS